MSYYNTNQFTYSKDSKTFVAEISDFAGKFSLRQIYDDACDEGFTLVSMKTGKECRYSMSQTVENEGGIQFWEFKAIDKVGAGTKVRVYND